MPTNLPLSCLTMAPRLDVLESHCNRKPLGEMNLNGYSEQIIACRVPNSPSRKPKPNNEVVESQRINLDIRTMLETLKDQIATVLKAKPARETASSAGTLKELLDSIIHNYIYWDLE